MRKQLALGAEVAGLLFFTSQAASNPPPPDPVEGESMAVISVVEPLPGPTFEQINTFRSELYLLTTYSLTDDLVQNLPEGSVSFVSPSDWKRSNPSKIGILSKVENFTEQLPYHVYRWNPDHEGIPYVRLSGPDILPVFRPLNPLNDTPEAHYENRLAAERMASGKVALDHADEASVDIGDGINLALESGDGTKLSAMEVWGAAITYPVNLDGFILSKGIYVQEQDGAGDWSLTLMLRSTVTLDPPTIIDANRSFAVFRAEPGNPIGTTLENIEIAFIDDSFVFTIAQPGIYYITNQRS